MTRRRFYNSMNMNLDNKNYLFDLSDYGTDVTSGTVENLEHKKNTVVKFDYGNIIVPPDAYSLYIVNTIGRNEYKNFLFQGSKAYQGSFKYNFSAHLVGGLSYNNGILSSLDYYGNFQVYLSLNNDDIESSIFYLYKDGVKIKESVANSSTISIIRHINPSVQVVASGLSFTSSFTWDDVPKVKIYTVENVGD